MRALALLARVALTCLLLAGLGARCMPPPGAEELDALIQEAGLVDETGAVIGIEDIERYGDLRVIVGPDAPENFAELFDMLESQPDLKDRVVAAVSASTDKVVTEALRAI